MGEHGNRMATRDLSHSTYRGLYLITAREDSMVESQVMLGLNHRAFGMAPHCRLDVNNLHQR